MKIKSTAVALGAAALLILGTAGPANAATNLPIGAISCSAGVKAGAVVSTKGPGFSVTLNNSTQNPRTFSVTYAPIKGEGLYIPRSPWQSHQGGIVRSDGQVAAGRSC